MGIAATKCTAVPCFPFLGHTLYLHGNECDVMIDDVIFYSRHFFTFCQLCPFRHLIHVN